MGQALRTTWSEFHSEQNLKAVASPELSLVPSATLLQSFQCAGHPMLSLPDLRFTRRSPFACTCPSTMIHVAPVVYNMSGNLACLTLFQRILPLFQEPQGLSSRKFWILPRSLILPLPVHMCSPQSFLVDQLCSYLGSLFSWNRAWERWNDHITNYSWLKVARYWGTGMGKRYHTCSQTSRAYVREFKVPYSPLN